MKTRFKLLAIIICDHCCPPSWTIRPGYGRARRRERGQGAQQRKRENWWQYQQNRSWGKGKGSKGNKGASYGRGGGKGWEEREAEPANPSSSSTSGRHSESTTELAWKAFHKLLDRKWVKTVQGTKLCLKLHCIQYTHRVLFQQIQEYFHISATSCTICITHPKSHVH